MTTPLNHLRCNGIQVQIRAGFNQVKFYFLSGGKNWYYAGANLDPVQLAGTSEKGFCTMQTKSKKLDVRVGICRKESILK
jgi:hypothetical protein